MTHQDGLTHQTVACYHLMAIQAHSSNIIFTLQKQENFINKGRHKRESKNAKQMRNTKQNCLSHSSASPRNDKQCSAKQCFVNQTNRCLAGFASRSDLFRDNARLTKHRRKVYQRYIILQAMYTTM